MVIPKVIYQQLCDVATEAAPIEACGLLAGRDSTVEKFFPMTNVDESEEHFSMDPKEQFAAVKEMRRLGLKMLAVWHSHPASPPRMSDEDKRLALTPGVVYTILSLAVPEAESISGFEIEDNEPRKIEIIIK